MTMAAGFVCSDGVLLCADTLYTDGYTKEYREKIFNVPVSGGEFAIALSGHADNARMAFDKAKAVLQSGNRKTDSIRSIVDVATESVIDVQRCFVDSRPHDEQEMAAFSLLIAAAARNQGAKLFVTEGRSGVAEIDTFACRGIARHLGQFIIAAGYSSEITVDQAAILGIHALTAAKEHVDGCGGPSQFYAIKNGIASPVVGHDVRLSEGMVQRYNAAMASTLLSIGDAELTEEVFERELARFDSFATKLRREWIAEGTHYRELAAHLSRPSKPTNS